MYRLRSVTSAPDAVDKWADKQARPTRLEVCAWLLLLVATFALSLKDYESFQIGVYMDDSSYAVLGQSLVSSSHYGMMNTPGSPAPTRYPFGYPMLLAPITLLFPSSPDAMKLVSLLATVVNCSLLFWGWHRLSPALSRKWGLAITAMYSLSPLTIGQTRMVMSEPVFTTWCLVSLVLFSPKVLSRGTWVRGLVLGVALAMTVFTRTVGLALVAVVLGHRLVAGGARVRGEVVATIAGMVVVTGLILAVTPVHLSDLLPSEYLEQFSHPSSWGQTGVSPSPIPRFLQGLTDYGTNDLRQVVIPVGGGSQEQALATRLGIPVLPSVLGLAVSAVVVLGYGRWLARDSLSPFLVYSLVYFAGIVLWPWRGPRFLYPIQPQLDLALLMGLQGLFLFASRATGTMRGLLAARARIVPATVFALTLCLLTYKDLTIDKSSAHVGDLEERTSWIRSNTSPSAVLMSEQPQTDFLWSGRKTVPMVDLKSAGDLQRYLSGLHVGYVLLGPQLEWQSKFVASYSQASLQVESQLDQLVSEGAVELTYSSPADRVMVFRVLR